MITQLFPSVERCVVPAREIPVMLVTGARALSNEPSQNAWEECQVSHCIHCLGPVRCPLGATLDLPWEQCTRACSHSHFCCVFSKLRFGCASTQCSPLIVSQATLCTQGQCSQTRARAASREMRKRAKNVTSLMRQSIAYELSMRHSHSHFYCAFSKLRFGACVTIKLLSACYMHVRTERGLPRLKRFSFFIIYDK
jgi:hypothetical protein